MPGLIGDGAERQGGRNFRPQRGRQNQADLKELTASRQEVDGKISSLTAEIGTTREKQPARESRLDALKKVRDEPEPDTSDYLAGFRRRTVGLAITRNEKAISYAKKLAAWEVVRTTC